MRFLIFLFLFCLSSSFSYQIKGENFLGCSASDLIPRLTDDKKSLDVFYHQNTPTVNQELVVGDAKVPGLNDGYEQVFRAANEKTKHYYEKNAQEYFNRTIKLDMTFAYKLFLKYIHPPAKILDIGSGAGRDTKYFSDLGFQVVSVDASAAMAKLSTQYTGQQTIHCNLEDLSFGAEFDGIWCSGVLLHFDQEHVIVALNKLVQLLKPKGIGFISFKYGTSVGFKEERFLLDQNESSLMTLLSKINHIEPLEIALQPDEQGNIIWINCIIKNNREEK